MTRRPADEVSLEVIEQWLTGTYQQPVENFAPLPGGFWTNAYGYRLGDQDLVLRLNHLSESFGIDVLAAEFSHLPVPKIFARGFALGHHFAISTKESLRNSEVMAEDLRPRFCLRPSLRYFAKTLWSIFGGC